MSRRKQTKPQHIWSGENTASNENSLTDRQSEENNSLTTSQSLIESPGSFQKPHVIAKRAKTDDVINCTKHNNGDVIDKEKNVDILRNREIYNRNELNEYKSVETALDTGKGQVPSLCTVPQSTSTSACDTNLPCFSNQNKLQNSVFSTKQITDTVSIVCDGKNKHSNERDSQSSVLIGQNGYNNIDEPADSNNHTENPITRISASFNHKNNHVGNLGAKLDSDELIFDLASSSINDTSPLLNRNRTSPLTGKAIAAKTWAETPGPLHSNHTFLEPNNHNFPEIYIHPGQLYNHKSSFASNITIEDGNNNNNTQDSSDEAQSPGKSTEFDETLLTEKSGKSASVTCAYPDPISDDSSPKDSNQNSDNIKRNNTSHTASNTELELCSTESYSKGNEDKEIAEITAKSIHKTKPKPPENNTRGYTNGENKGEQQQQQIQRKHQDQQQQHSAQHIEQHSTSHTPIQANFRKPRYPCAVCGLVLGSLGELGLHVHEHLPSETNSSQFLPAEPTTLFVNQLPEVGQHAAVGPHSSTASQQANSQSELSPPALLVPQASRMLEGYHASYSPKVSTEGATPAHQQSKHPEAPTQGSERTPTHTPTRTPTADEKNRSQFNFHSPWEEFEQNLKTQASSKNSTSDLADRHASTSSLGHGFETKRVKTESDTSRYSPRAGGGVESFVVSEGSRNVSVKSLRYGGGGLTPTKATAGSPGASHGAGSLSDMSRTDLWRQSPFLMTSPLSAALLSPQTAQNALRHLSAYYGDGAARSMADWFRATSLALSVSANSGNGLLESSASGGFNMAALSPSASRARHPSSASSGGSGFDPRTGFGTGADRRAESTPPSAAAAAQFARMRSAPYPVHESEAKMSPVQDSASRAMRSSGLYGFKQYGSSGSLDSSGETLRSSSDSLRGVAEIAEGSRMVPRSSSDLTDPLLSPVVVKTERPQSGYGDLVPSSNPKPSQLTAQHSEQQKSQSLTSQDALNNLKTLTASSFAYPALPGFSNAFGAPWPHQRGPPGALGATAGALSKISPSAVAAAAVNGYLPRLQGKGSDSSPYSPRLPPSTTPTGPAPTSSPFRNSLGKPSTRYADTGLACQYCGKVCPRPSILKRHMMMHTGERPFECKVCGQRFRAKGSMLFHQKLRHAMDVKLNKALEERYLQIVTNQKQKQMREERKKAALSSKDSTAWFQQEVHSWMLQNQLQAPSLSPASSTAPLAIAAQLHSNAKDVARESSWREEVSARQRSSNHGSKPATVTSSTVSDNRESISPPPLVGDITGFTSSSSNVNNNKLLTTNESQSSRNRNRSESQSEQPSSERYYNKDSQSISGSLAQKQTTDLAGKSHFDNEAASYQSAYHSKSRESKSSVDSVFREHNSGINEQTQDDFDNETLMEEEEEGDINGNVDSLSTKSNTSENTSKYMFSKSKPHPSTSNEQSIKGIAAGLIGATPVGEKGNDESALNSSNVSTTEGFGFDLEAYSLAYQRLRELMWTPEMGQVAMDTSTSGQPQQTGSSNQTASAYDANCNLKESLDRMIMNAFSKLGLDNYLSFGSGGSGSGGGGGVSSATSLGGVSTVFPFTPVSVMAATAHLLHPVGGNQLNIDTLGTSQPADVVSRGNENQPTSTVTSSSQLSPSGTRGGGSNTLGSGSNLGASDKPTNENNESNEEILVDFPSLFPGLKQQLSIRNETVIISRLEGVNTTTGDRIALYKCYLCGKVFHQLSMLQLHLSTHFEKRITVYQCLYCTQYYRFKTQLVQHLQTAHRVELNLEDGQIPEVPAASEMVVLTDSVESLGNLETGSQPTSQPPENETENATKSETESETRSSRSGSRSQGSGLSVMRQGNLYVCRYCHKSFDRSFSVVRHERMHTGYKPCLCLFCGRGFSEPRNLRQHIARFHSGSQSRSGSLSATTTGNEPSKGDDSLPIEASTSRNHRRHNSCPGNVQQRMSKTPEVDAERQNQRLDVSDSEIVMDTEQSEDVDKTRQTTHQGRRRIRRSSDRISSGTYRNNRGSLRQYQDDHKPDTRHSPMTNDEIESARNQSTPIDDSYPVTTPTSVTENDEAMETGYDDDNDHDTDKSHSKSAQHRRAHRKNIDRETEMAAKEIRAKERLGEDVTVVIPSDAPLDSCCTGNASEEDEENGSRYEESALLLETPRSVLSDKTSWSNFSEDEAESPDGGRRGEILAAPVRSLIGSHQFRSLRRSSVQGRSLTPTHGVTGSSNSPAVTRENTTANVTVTSSEDREPVSGSQSRSDSLLPGSSRATLGGFQTVTATTTGDGEGAKTPERQSPEMQGTQPEERTENTQPGEEGSETTSRTPTSLTGEDGASVCSTGTSVSNRHTSSISPHPLRSLSTASTDWGGAEERVSVSSVFPVPNIATMRLPGATATMEGGGGRGERWREGHGASPLAQYTPLSVSTFLSGLPGILPSPLMSPAQAAFFAQAGIASPTMLGGALPFMTSFTNSASSLAGGGALSSPANCKEAVGSGGSSASSDNTRESQPHMYAHSQPLSQPFTQPHKQPQDRREEDRGGEELAGPPQSVRGPSRSSSRLHNSSSSGRTKLEVACKPTILADGRTVYRCTCCHKDFSTYADISRHMDYHEGRSTVNTDVRPYKCKFCDYYARTNSQLKVHMMRHQGIREFHCKLCNYKGVTQSDLNRHMKSQIHLMKAQNECSACGEGFVSPKNLDRHIEERHMTNMAANMAATSGSTGTANQRSAAVTSSGSSQSGDTLFKPRPY